jgi:thiamine-phosphate pyrophosphorylase
VIELTAGAIRGTLVVQLRDKSAAPRDLERAGRRLRAITSRAGALFVVNAATAEALRVALTIGADGAHVPCRAATLRDARARLGAAAWISTPAHTDDDVAVAARAGATSVLVSPIWESPGKGPARGVAALLDARAACRNPRDSERAALLVYALGGVDASRAAACAEAGADGVAVIRALLEAPDPAAAARALDAPLQKRGPIAGGPGGV